MDKDDPFRSPSILPAFLLLCLLPASFHQPVSAKTEQGTQHAREEPDVWKRYSSKRVRKVGSKERKSRRPIAPSFGLVPRSVGFLRSGLSASETGRDLGGARDGVVRDGVVVLRSASRAKKTLCVHRQRVKSVRTGPGAEEKEGPDFIRKEESFAVSKPKETRSHDPRSSSSRPVPRILGFGPTRSHARVAAVQSNRNRSESTRKSGFKMLGNDDGRCYLSTGGGSVTLLVQESVEPGQEVGSVDVVGEPDRDIRLSLIQGQEHVDIVPGTKILRLKHPLDREGEEGPPSLNLGVECVRIGTNYPVSFSPVDSRPVAVAGSERPDGFQAVVIPVYVKVLDDNDNAPEFVGAPYTVNVSELTVPGSTILTVRSRDKDQDGPHSTVQYAIVQGLHSDLVEFVPGPSGGLRLRERLDHEKLSRFTVGIRALDQGQPVRHSESSITVIVLDGDDQNPKFHHPKYTAKLPEPPKKGLLLAVEPRGISAYDQDVGLNVPLLYSLDADEEESKYFWMDPYTGKVRVKEDIPDSALRQPLTLLIKATQSDNPDRTAVSTLTVSRDGLFLERLEFLQEVFSAVVMESIPVPSTIIRLATNHIADKSLMFTFESAPEERGNIDWLKSFAVNSQHDLVLRKPLDYEQRNRFLFRVLASNGITNASAWINVTVLNVNDHDPEFDAPEYGFVVTSNAPRPGIRVGGVKVKDRDAGDRISLHLRGPHARSFSVEEDGSVYLRNMAVLNVSTAHFVVIARDSGSPPRQASVPVSVRFPSGLVSGLGWGWGVGEDASSWLLIAMGILLGILFFTVIALILYISKSRSAEEGSEDERRGGKKRGENGLGNRVGPAPLIPAFNVSLQTPSTSPSPFNRIPSAYSGTSRNGTVRNPLALGIGRGPTPQPQPQPQPHPGFSRTPSTTSSHLARGPKVSSRLASSDVSHAEAEGMRIRVQRPLDPSVSATPAPSPEKPPLTVYF
ncbi:unnamed protein product [Darwinula stevensoni]|uniref:Cadherin domain-containing protein n=1 Tax=Darwinula stevensoni TaxID=69355 RepID=A0A7R8XEM8_9CRUS|nr:unnamed protein product [Darwinula stevensoni]CAG0889742.1 unnamed protein product [Darwinula stevensoni]